MEAFYPALMYRLERWALGTLLYTFAMSVFRHSLWCGFNTFCILLSLFENVIIILAFLPAFTFHKTCVTPEKSWVWSIPLFGWLIYAWVCMIFKILFLTSLFM